MTCDSCTVKTVLLFHSVLRPPVCNGHVLQQLSSIFNSRVKHAPLVLHTVRSFVLHAVLRAI